MLPFAQLLSPLLLLVTKGKFTETLRGQKGALQDLHKKLQAHSNQEPVLWVHVSSAGEFLQARPVMDELKKQNPKVFIALSFVSPSGMSWGLKYGKADVVFYAPLDTASNMQKVVAFLKPQVLLLVKFDLWPNMILQSKASGCRVILISAT